MKSLSELMKDRSWEQDWPTSIKSVDPVPSTWPSARDLPENIQAVAHLLADNSGCPTVLDLRDTLSGLETWNEWAAQYLTFPPTAVGMGKALAKGLSATERKQINDLTHQVVLLYPALSWAALEAVPAQAASLRTDSRASWWPAPALHAAPPVPSEPVHAPAAASAKVPDVKRSASPAQGVPSSSSKPVRVNHAPRWIREQLLPIARRKETSAPLLMQEMDEAIKNHFNQTIRPDWAEEVLLPSLMGLTGDELGDLMSHWPPSARYPIAKPIDLVSQPKFWAQLRDAEPAAQKKLVSDVLPQVIQSDDWSTEDRLRMLRQMLRFVRSNREGFEQRIELWQNWGGNLHEKGVLAGDRANEAKEDSAFGISAAAKSGMDWISEQDNDMWKAWAADQANVSPTSRRSPRPR